MSQNDQDHCICRGKSNVLSSTRSSSRLPTPKNKCVRIRNHEEWQDFPITHDLGKGSSFRTRKTKNKSRQICRGSGSMRHSLFGDVPKHFLRNETSVSKVFRQHLKVLPCDSSLLSFHHHNPNVSFRHPSHFPSKRILFNMSPTFALFFSSLQQFISVGPRRHRAKPEYFLHHTNVSPVGSTPVTMSCSPKCALLHHLCTAILCFFLFLLCLTTARNMTSNFAPWRPAGRKTRAGILVRLIVYNCAE